MLGLPTVPKHQVPREYDVYYGYVRELLDPCYDHFGHTFVMGTDDFHITVAQWGATVLSIKFRREDQEQAGLLRFTTLDRPAPLT